MGNKGSSNDVCTSGESLSRPLLPGSIVAFGATGIYRVNLENGSVQKMTSGNWGSIRSSVRDPCQDKMFAFGPMGVYCVAKDGTHTKYLSGNWAAGDQSRGQTACYVGSGRAVYIGATGIYSVNLYEPTYTNMVGGNWGNVNVAVYNPDDGCIYAIGARGVYKVNVNNGEHETVASGAWGCVDAAMWRDKETMVCFGAKGVYRLSLKDGSDTKLASGAWGGIHVALPDPEGEGIIALGVRGLYRVSSMDGTHEKVLRGNWGTRHAAIYDPTPIELSSVAKSQDSRAYTSLSSLLTAADSRAPCLLRTPELTRHVDFQECGRGRLKPSHCEVLRCVHMEGCSRVPNEGELDSFGEPIPGAAPKAKDMDKESDGEQRGRADGPDQILQRLYLGDRRDGQAEWVMQDLGITHVLSVHNKCKFPANDCGYEYLHEPMSDFGDDSLKDFLPKVLPYIVRGLERGKVFVHCQMGVNRSATVVICYLMQHQNFTFRRAYSHTQAMRPRISPHELYFEQMQNLEQELFGKVTLTRADVGPSMQEQVREIRALSTVSRADLQRTNSNGARGPAGNPEKSADSTAAETAAEPDARDVPPSA